MGALAAWAPAIIAVITAVFITGQVTGRIKDQEKTLAAHDTRLGIHDVRLGEHDVSIARTEGFQEGYKTGKAQPK